MGILDWLQILRLTGDFRSLHKLCGELGHVAVPVPGGNTLKSDWLRMQVADAKEHGEAAAALLTALSEISPGGGTLWADWHSLRPRRPKGVKMALNPQALVNGQEQFEAYQSKVVNRRMIQYDYRHTDGDLFSCVAHILLQARRKRDRWLEAKSINATRKRGQRASMAKKRGLMITGLCELGLK